MKHCQSSPHGFHNFRLVGYARRCQWCELTRAELAKAAAERRARIAAIELAKCRALLGMESLTRKVGLSDLIAPQGDA